MKKSSITIVFAFYLLLNSKAQDFFKQTTASTNWVDSVYNSLSKKERVAQLMIIRAHSNLGQDHVEGVTKLIKKYNVGGLCFFQGGPARQANLTNFYQSIAQTPLMITIDAEWGVGMRLDSVQNFPRQLMMGALPQNQAQQAVYSFGKAVAHQCKRLGIHVNFAPVVDVNNNPNNPVINDRSFGENKNKVANYGAWYTKGMQDQNVMACAKHFPGHGDVAVDSHLDLPIITKSLRELQQLELYPFKKLIDEKVGSVMMAHLYLPSIDSTANQASSLSKNAVTNLLKKEMGYNGLTFTDALEMKGVSKFYPAGQASVQSLIAGNDLLCLPGDVKGSIKKVVRAIRKKEIDKNDFEARVKKVLLAKYNLGLTSFTSLSTENIVADLNKETQNINQQIAANAITFVKQTNPEILPLPTTVGNKDVLPRVAYLSIGNGKENTITKALQNGWSADVIYYNNSYAKSDSIKETIEPQAGIQLNDTKDKIEQAVKCLQQIKEGNYQYVIIGVHNYSRRPANNFGLSNAAVYLMQQLESDANNLFLFFGNPYAMKNVCNAKNILACYEDDAITQATTFDMLTGKLKPKGELPVTVCENFKATSSITNGTEPSKKKYSSQTIDSIVENAIKQQAFPGAVVYAYANGKEILHKAYGHTTYAKTQEVTTNLLYDLASVTKIAATTVAVMKLFEEGKLELDKTLGDYLPQVKGSNKESLTVRNILLHQAGLVPFIPFYKVLIDSASGIPNWNYFSKTKNEKYSVQVADSLFVLTAYQDTIQQRILNSKLTVANKYVYSDNDFIYLGKIVEAITQKPLPMYLQKQFYKPLGMGTTCFKPSNLFPKQAIVPTEYENHFRQQQIWGHVHDEGAALMGGIAGHAGLFSNAKDLAQLFIMLLNNGSINGINFLKPETIELFTKYNSDVSRRGLGFDKPEKNNATSKDPYPSILASSKTYGHTGFTGTCVWVDPEKKLVFVFLSNRVNPTRNNNKLSSLAVRRNLLDAVYGMLEE